MKTSGDGFLATFDSPARAVSCAGEIVDGVASLGHRVCAGVHTWECELRNDDVAGIAVDIASRVMHEAAAGEVLASSTVKDLVAGSGLRFADHGPHSLRGVQAGRVAALRAGALRQAAIEPDPAQPHGRVT